MKCLAPVLRKSGQTFAGMVFLFINAAYAADIKISDAMVRAVPPTSTNTAAFFTLENTGNTAVRLINADSSIAERVEIHGHRHEGHKMVMFKMDDLDLPAGKPVKLESGGTHIMIMGLKRSLDEGDKIPLTLHFSDSDAIDIKVPVKSLIKTMSKDPHSGMKH